MQVQQATAGEGTTPARQQAQGGAAAGSSGGGSGGGSGTPECLRKLRALCMDEAAAAAESEAAAGAQQGGTALPPAETLALLRGLCGGAACDGFLAHILAGASGDVEAAASYLLDAEDLGAEQRAWELRVAEEEEERRRGEEERALNRKLIVDK